MIQVFKPSMTQEEIDAVAEVLRSGWIGLGPKTAEFENKFAEFIGTSYAVAVNSCTAALDLALKLLDVNHGHEVIVPTMTFVSTAHCVAYRLAMPVFADVDPHTLSLDLEDVRRKITSRTRAIIPVHYSGLSIWTPCERSPARSPSSKTAPTPRGRSTRAAAWARSATWAVSASMP